MSCKKVSVILPVYNAEKYIKKCIESILNQSYKNIEIIVVNDGSVDNSKNIIDEYSKIDKRIKKFHIDNSGPSFARNLGISSAEGEFIQFVDADDYIDKNMIKELINKMNDESDLVICGYRSLVSTGLELKTLNYDFLDSGNLRKDNFLEVFGVLFRDYYISYPWNKLYKADIIKENDIQFDNSIKWGEDLIFNIEYIKYCNFFSFIKRDLYIYNQNNDSSITSNYNKQYFENQLMMYTKIINFLNNESVFVDKNKEIINDKISDIIIESILNLVNEKSKLTNKEILNNINRIINWERTEETIPYYKNKSFKRKIIGILIKRKSSVSIFILLQIKRLLDSTKR